MNYSYSPIYFALVPVHFFVLSWFFRLSFDIQFGIIFINTIKCLLRDEMMKRVVNKSVNLINILIDLF